MSDQRTEAALATAPAKREKIFTLNFLLACLTTLASFSSFYLLLATLPVYVIKSGANESQVGLIMGVFSATTVLLRPFIGKWADDRGRRLFILTGTTILALCGGLYNFARSVPLLLGLRVVHGVGWASFGTSINTVVADVVPRSRRGEAMGYYGMFSNLAMAVGPAIGVMLMTGYSFTTLFLVSAGMAVVSALLSIGIREPHRASPPAVAKGGGQGIIERSALFPAMVLTLITITYGSIVTFVPLYATKQGIDNPGFFFTAYAITLIAARGFTGQLSDRYGRASVIVPGLILATAALWILANATSFAAFLLVAVLYGLAFAASQPAIMAMVVDRAAPNRRGAAMGTFSAAMDLGIGVGSVVWGVVVQRAGYSMMYTASGVVALLALALFLAGVQRGELRKHA